MISIKQWKNYFLFTVASLLMLLFSITFVQVIIPQLEESDGAAASSFNVDLDIYSLAINGEDDYVVGGKGQGLGQTLGNSYFAIYDTSDNQVKSASDVLDQYDSGNSIYIETDSAGNTRNYTNISSSKLDAYLRGSGLIHYTHIRVYGTLKTTSSVYLVVGHMANSVYTDNGRRYYYTGVNTSINNSVLTEAVSEEYTSGIHPFYSIMTSSGYYYAFSAQENSPAIDSTFRNRIINSGTSFSGNQYRYYRAQYNITYSDGTTDTYLAGVAKPLKAAPAASAGYYTDGWKDSDTGDALGTTISTANANKDYNLVPNEIANEYTINFDANGGTLNIGAQIKVPYGSTYTMPSTSAATRTGYTLTGWRAVVGNSTYTYSPGERITVPNFGANKTRVYFYAQWKANTYTVKFNDQGGTTNFADMVLIDSTYKTNGTYTFTRNGVTVTYDVSDSALTLNGKPTNDINLFINLGLSFTQNDVYKVSYQKISGSMSGNTTGCFVLEVCDASWALLETRNRVDFHMNNSSGSANLTISSSGATQGSGLKLWFWCNENATPSRVFNNFKVKFKIEKSGTQNVQKQTRFTYGSALEAVAPPTRVGYNFQGYYTQTGGRGTRYFDSSGHPVVSTMNIANNTTTLHAYWTIKTDCTIFYDSSAAGNFDNWTKYTYGDRIDSSYDESSQTNTINITGGGGWETMAIPIYFPTTGVRYTTTFNYSGTFEYLSGYNGLRMQLLTSQPAAGNNQNIQAAYANLTSHSAGTTASATISITPSQNIYYLTLNLGYLKDDDPYTLTFNNFNFTSTSGEAARVYQSGHTFNQAVTNLMVPADRGNIFTGWVTESGKAFNSGSTMNAEEIYLNAQWADTWGNHYSSALTQDTSDDYWMISSSEDLARLIYLFNYTARIDVLKMKFKLTNHIDMSDHYWLPLGTEDRVFSALIDGRGYTIKGLRTISQSLRKDNGGDNSGFIGVSGSYTEKSSTGVTTKYEATIKNIYFEDISINGRNYVAGVVGSVLGDTTISAIAVVGEIYGTNIRGGIAAYAPSTSLATISDCLVDVSPSNIVIRNNYITATNSVNYSTGKLAKTSGTFTNWIENLTGMKYTMLPKGLTWIAEGK